MQFLPATYNNPTVNILNEMGGQGVEKEISEETLIVVIKED